MPNAEVVVADPLTLMQDDGGPALPTNRDQMNGNVVLVGASGGPAAAKALIAQSFGATGVLIVNDDEENPSELANMDDDFAHENSVQVTIPVVMISNASCLSKFTNDQYTLVDFKAPAPTPIIKAGGTLRFEVRPIDVDGFPIADTAVSFVADLASPEMSTHKQSGDVNSTLCKITLTDGVYTGECDFPAHNDDGNTPWTDDGFSLAIKPTGDDEGNEIGRQRIDVTECPKEYFYDDVDENGCLSCDAYEGIQCPAGTTRTRLPVDRGYWRLNEKSLVVLACPW